MAKKVKAKQAKPIKTTEVELPKFSESLELVKAGIIPPSSVVGTSVYYVHPKYRHVSWGWVLSFGNDKVFILNNENNIVIVEPDDITYTENEAQKIKKDKYWW